MKRTIPSLYFCAVVFLSAAPAYAQPQTLEQTLTLAYQKNPGLMAERAKLRATDEQVSVALSGYRPSVDAIAEAGKTSSNVTGHSTNSGSSNLDPKSLSVQLKQPVFSGFKTSASVDSAKSTVKAQRAGLQAAEQKLFLDTSKAFLDVIQATTIVLLNRDNEQVLKQQLEATQDRFNVGELKKTDVSQAESRLKAAMVSRLQAEGDLANQRATFARLVGDMPGTLEQPKIKSEYPKTLDEVISIALGKNPSIIAAENSFDSAKSDVTVAAGDLWPQLDIVGSSTRGWDQSNTIKDRQDSSTIMARVTVPLYRSGSDYAKTRAAQQTTTQRRMELEYARQKAREEAMNAWQSLETARAAISGRKEVVDATAAALEGVKEESKAGTRTTLDVLNAEQELLEAKINYAKAEHDEAYASLQLKSAIGELTASAMKLPVDIYDPSKNYDDARGAWLGFADTED